MRVPVANAAVIVMLCSFLSQAVAGPNSGGTLLLHAEIGVTYTSEEANYCAQSTLSDCDLATISAPELTTTVVFVMAAFPDSSHSRLSGVSFGMDFDPLAISVADHGHCGDFELSTAEWPDPGSGTSVTWTSPRLAPLEEVYWMALYAYHATTVAVDAHPVQDGVFADDSVPANLDPITAYGTLGFGVALGNAVCPDTTETGESQEASLPPCEFPAVVSIATGNHFELQTAEGSTILTNTHVTFDWDDERGLSANGVLLVPKSPVRNRPSAAVLARLHSDVPFVQDLISQGWSLEDATLVFTDSVSTVIRMAMAGYARSIRNKQDPRIAADAAAVTIENHPFFSSTDTSLDYFPGALNHTITTRLVGHETYRDIELSSREPRDPMAWRYSKNDACRLVSQLGHILSTPHARPRVITARKGTLVIRGGTPAETHLYRGGKR